MSTQHRPADSTYDPPPESGTRAAAAPTGTTLQRTDRRSDIADRVERARLRAQVAALERSLAESERRRQAIVDQYELILDGRDATASSADREPTDAASGEPDAEGDGPVARLQRLLPVVG